MRECGLYLPQVVLCVECHECVASKRREKVAWKKRKEEAFFLAAGYLESLLTPYCFTGQYRELFEILWHVSDNRENKCRDRSACFFFFFFFPFTSQAKTHRSISLFLLFPKGLTGKLFSRFIKPTKIYGETSHCYTAE